MAVKQLNKTAERINEILDRALLYEAQSLSEEQKSQVLNNLGIDVPLENFGASLQALISGGEADKIDNFNEIVAFLDGIPTDEGTLFQILSGLASGIPTKTSQLTNDSGFQTSSQVSSAITSAIAGKANSGAYSAKSGVTSATIQPNTFTDFGTVASLAITLGSVASDASLENRMFGFQFTSGTTATTLTLPDTVKFPEDPTIEAGYTYQVTILNNLALISGWPNA